MNYLRRFLYVTVLFLLFSLCACQAPADFIHKTAEYVTETQIGKPEVALELSTGKYAYESLPDDEKVLYNQIYDCIIGHKSDIPLFIKDEEIIEKAYKCVLADHGGLFWVDGYNYKVYKKGDYVTGFTISPSYTMDRAGRDDIQTQIDIQCDKWLQDAPTFGSDYEKAKYIYDLLIHEVDYDINATNNQNIISVFINKATVCQGYANAAEYMFEKLQIPCTVITGDVGDTGHAWNMVVLDGDYYFFDATWGNSSYRDGDTDQKIVDYGFLNITSDMIFSTHSIDMPIPIPECTATDNNYFVKSGLYFTEWNQGQIGEAVSSYYNGGEDSVSMMFTDPGVYFIAKEHLLTEKHFADYCQGLKSISYLDDPGSRVLTLKFK